MTTVEELKFVFIMLREGLSDRGFEAERWQSECVCLHLGNWQFLICSIVDECNANEGGSGQQQ